MRCNAEYKYSNSVMGAIDSTNLKATICLYLAEKSKVLLQKVGVLHKTCGLT